jgi:two-component system sensor histidine kinase CreC
LTAAKPEIMKVGLLGVLAAILLSLLASGWITRPIKRLTCYAIDIRQGRRVKLPPLDKSEIGEMGHAFEKMREALEGKNYVEQYVQTLTHEIKSPVSAIRGAAELLEEKMAPERRARFLANIRSEANRIQTIVDRLLELAELENRKMLQKAERIAFEKLVDTVIESKRPFLTQKSLGIVKRVPHAIRVKGDAFLLYQAVANLIQNAIDFSPAGGQITLTAYTAIDKLTFQVDDSGPGVPAYAKEKIFDKFFSLQRPDSGKKSTGLGLNFVAEVALLHNGAVHLENRLSQGVRATLILAL